MELLLTTTGSCILFIFLILLKCRDKQEAKIRFETNYERYKYYNDVV